MNKEQQELLDEAYENFIDKTKGLNLNLEINRDIIVVEGPIYNATPRLLSQEEFINKIKTDTEFSERWGLKIEERELSLDERVKLTMNTPEYRNYTEEQWKEYIDSTSSPTRLITITYKKTIIESYES